MDEMDLRAHQSHHIQYRDFSPYLPKQLEPKQLSVVDDIAICFWILGLCVRFAIDYVPRPHHLEQEYRRYGINGLHMVD